MLGPLMCKETQYFFTHWFLPKWTTTNHPPFLLNYQAHKHAWTFSIFSSFAIVFFKILHCVFPSVHFKKPSLLSQITFLACSTCIHQYYSSLTKNIFGWLEPPNVNGLYGHLRTSRGWAGPIAYSPVYMQVWALARRAQVIRTKSEPKSTFVSVFVPLVKSET